MPSTETSEAAGAPFSLLPGYLITQLLWFLQHWPCWVFYLCLLHSHGGKGGVGRGEDRNSFIQQTYEHPLAQKLDAEKWTGYIPGRHRAHRVRSVLVKAGRASRHHNSVWEGAVASVGEEGILPRLWWATDTGSRWCLSCDLKGWLEVAKLKWGRKGPVSAMCRGRANKLRIKR